MFPIERNKLSSYDEIKRGFLEADLQPRSVGASHTPNWLLWFFRGGIVLLILFLIAIMFVPWQQVSIGRGSVISYSTANRGQRVQAPVFGRIEKWLVQEGQEVQKGEQLVELSDLDERILNRLGQQLEAAKLRLQAAERAITVGTSNLERQEALLEKGLSSERDVELAKIDYAKFEVDLSTAQTTVAELEVKIARQLSQSVRAPFDGIVVRVLVPDGGTVVNAGDSLALLVPSTKDRAVELTISGIDMPLISPGRKVRLQFEGWPAVQFTGWPSVAVGTFGGVVQVVDAIDDGRGNYRVLVFPDPEDDPWPDERYLRQGVRSIGWILLDEVSLGWEIWRQLNSFPMTVDNYDSDVEKDSTVKERVNDSLL